MGLVGLFLALIASFYLLAVICDEYFVPSLDKIAKKLKMSSDIAGATLMAVGSSAPELFVASIALIKPGGHGAIGMGTIVGSAIFNVLVIIGASAVVKRAKLTWQPVIRDTIFYTISIAILIFIFADAKVTLLESLTLVIIYGIYILAVFYWRRIFHYRVHDDLADVDEMVKEVATEIKKKFVHELTRYVNIGFRFIFPGPKHYYGVFFVSIAWIAGLSWVLVESAVAISHIMNIPEAIIALTILAAGTSIPDMMSSMIVARQGRGGMAISNAIGSNIFDILIGLGLPFLLMLIFVGGTIPVSTENLMSSIILLFATVIVIFFLLLIRRWSIGRKSGWFLIALYVAYLVWAISEAM